jgi:PHD/YefM family antitoxin component YafN of YafNO toxin-antitoxin module
MRVVRREAVPGQALVTGQAPEEGAPHMAKSMEVVPSGELQKQFGRYSDEAMIRPVGVSRNGRVRFVMVPVDEYERLRRRERVAGRVEDLDDETLEAIRVVEPGRGSEAAEKRLNAS